MNEANVIFDAKRLEPKEEEKEEEKIEQPEVKPVEKTKLGILSPEAEILLIQYKKILAKEQAGSAEPNIEVSQVLAPVAFLYERVRNAVDYKREHLLKRNAIERILRRQIWERPGRDTDKLTQVLVRELTWARYIKNDSVPKSKVKEISRVIEKYLNIFYLIGKKTKKEDRLSKASELRGWFFGVASCEIEEIIDPDIHYLDILNYPVFLWFKKHFDWQGGGLSEKDKDVQILIAVHRSLPKSDEPRIRYHLLSTFYPEWSSVDENNLEKEFNNFLDIRIKIEDQINSPIQHRIYRFVQKQAAAFQILKEVIEKDIDQAEKLFNKPKKLEESIHQVCTKRYDDIRKKVSRGVTRSVVYIFTTKVIFAFLLEVPYELIFEGSLNYLSLIINSIIPPSLMFFVGLTIKRPGEANTKRIVGTIKSFVYKKEDKRKIAFSLSTSNRNSVSYRIFLSIYTSLFLLTFGVISYFLILLGFNFLSGTIFFVFLSLVLLFGYRVRFAASELNVTGEREGLISHLLSNITLPFLNLGVWLSRGLSKFNFLIVGMDFLIETPLKNMIAVFEEWTIFIREKKEEVVEVPG